tara:strand:- start:965 stop:1396 length:432 start_codon:yes stop_codon:yes gene_type:complete
VAFFFCTYRDKILHRACATADGGGQKQTNAWAKRQAIAETRYQTALRSLKLVQKIAPTRDPRDPAPTAEQNDTPPKVDDSAPDTGVVSRSEDNNNGCTAGPAQKNGSNGRGRTKVVPMANGREVNRVFAAIPQTEPALSAADG